MMRKVYIVARKECSLLLGSRAFRLGLLLPTVVVVAIMFIMAGDVRQHAARQSAPTPGMAVPDEGLRPASPVETDGPPDGGDARAVSVGAAYVFVMMMFFGIMVLSQYLLTNLIEEKSSRVVEVLLSAVSPFELMSGKILGLAAAGLIGVAACSAIIAAVAVTRGLIQTVNPWALVFFVVYYVPGILLVSSMYAAVGSACNTLREAQGLMLPMALIFMVPLLAWMHIAQHPNGLLAVALSFCPPVIPMVMILRLAVSSAVPLWQIVASLLLLMAAVPATMWAASKIFRTGVLMYGKPPRLREMLRWLRYK